MVWLIKKKFVFNHAHFHVGYLDAFEKTVYILSDNHIMTNPKKRFVSINDADHFLVYCLYL